LVVAGIELGDHHVVDRLAIDVFGDEAFIVQQCDDACGVGLFGEGVEGLDVTFHIVDCLRRPRAPRSQRGDRHLRHAELLRIGDALVWLLKELGRRPVRGDAAQSPVASMRRNSCGLYFWRLEKSA
jgi:hypothetical protein